MVGVIVITTGGTIGALPYEDPQHPPQFSSMPPDGRDLVRDALATTFSSFNARCISLEPRDSKLIDECYRRNVLAIVESAAENAVIITHGTDTILKTADFFHQQFLHNPSLKKKTIILTGSMTPISNGAGSDGYLNLGFSLSCLVNLAPGMEKTNIVLCDFAKDSWQPRLYPHSPNRYEKFYDSDGRYHRLCKVPANGPLSPTAKRAPISKREALVM